MGRRLKRDKSASEGLQGSQIATVAGIVGGVTAVINWLPQLGKFLNTTITKLKVIDPIIVPMLLGLVVFGAIGALVIMDLTAGTKAEEDIEDGNNDTTVESGTEEKVLKMRDYKKNKRVS